MIEIKDKYCREFILNILELIFIQNTKTKYILLINNQKSVINIPGIVLLVVKLVFKYQILFDDFKKYLF